MAGLSVWTDMSAKRRTEVLMAMVMIPAAFLAPRFLTGRWLAWGLPLFMLAMFGVIDAVRLGWRNLGAAEIARMLFVDALVILPFHLLVLWVRGIL